MVGGLGGRGRGGRWRGLWFVFVVAVVRVSAGAGDGILLCALGVCCLYLSRGLVMEFYRVRFVLFVYP